MARKKVVRNLPELAEVFPKFSGFSAKENQQDKLTSELRRAALSLQKDEPRPFYAMRDVAAHFGVTHRTVARAYEVLRKQRLLITIRSSFTEIAGHSSRTRSHVRGIVGVPIWLPGFQMFPEWRLFFISLEEELRAHSFVADLVFYAQGQELHSSFSGRLMRHTLDFALWFCPSRADKDTVTNLEDAGIPTVLINDRTNVLPGRYIMDWNGGLQPALESWFRDGVRRVLIPCVRKDRAAPCAEDISRILQQNKMDVEFVEANKKNTAEYLRSLTASADQGIVFSSDFWYSHLASLHPVAMARILNENRCLIFRMKYTFAKERVCTDLVTFDYPAIARKIAEDFARGRAIVNDEPVVFRSEFHRGISTHRMGAMMRGL
jgi:hypothetical protein